MHRLETFILAYMNDVRKTYPPQSFTWEGRLQRNGKQINTDLVLILVSRR